MTLRQLLFFTLAICISLSAFAKVNIGIPAVSPEVVSGKTEMDCNASAAQVDLNINNVRARLLTGGDLWWDPIGGQAQYEVPKIAPGSGDPSRHSIFAGALWIGGIDQLGQLKVAAQTYRQGGNDFWPGPLDDDGQASQESCNDFDRFFEVLGKDIDDFRSRLDAAGGSLPVSAIPESILRWPARNNIYASIELPFDKNLAPFWSDVGNIDYDPTQGDYPVIDNTIEGVYADQMIWWMFNDRGNTHTETGGEAIGLQVGALAFAFATNDEVNNMTFYKYEIDNRSTQPLDSVFFGQWVDPDLGQFDDDFVGCVVEEGLGIVYNGDAVDGDYGDTPPMLGVDFFQGPKEQVGFDENGEPIFEELGMSAFVYYNNDFSVTGNPENASHFYGYLAGVWKDGTPFTCGGNAYGGTETCDFMFPGDPTDPDAWSECSEDNTPADRRFLQASGPFTLEPGAVNDVIVGVVWVGEGLQYPCPTFEPIVRADKKAQALFDNNFKLKDGPDAPSMSVVEMNQKLILTIFNDTLQSNNKFESYVESDPVLASQGFPDSTYQFQGYKLYQLASGNVSPAEYNDPDKARLIKVVDIKDGVTSIINYTFDSQLGSLVPSLEVAGTDQGIEHSFIVEEDLFATGTKKLVNYKKYYFSALAYSFNAHEAYNTLDPSETAQLIPYLEGRNNIGIYIGIPHKAAPQNGGTVLNADYGDGPEITQLSGYGNGGTDMNLSQESIDQILAEGSDPTPTYEGGAGPVKVNIYNPYIIPNTKYELCIEDVVFPELTNPQNGSVSINDADATITYTPNGGFEGYDYFMYKLMDRECIADWGVVVMGVGAATTSELLAFPNTAVAEIGTSIDIDAISNDYAPAGSTVSYESVDAPIYGTAVIDIDDNEIVYTAAAGFVGQDEFTYTVTDGTTSKTATVFVRTYESDGTSTFVALDAVDDYVNAPDGTQLVNPMWNDAGDISISNVSPLARWTLRDVNSGEVYNSETTIKKSNEQDPGGWESGALGFTIDVEQQALPSNSDAFIDASISFENVQRQWLGAVGDVDGQSQFNWIRSGTFAGEQAAFTDNRIPPEDYYDPNQYYETILGGNIAPYCLTSHRSDGGLAPACPDCTGDFSSTFPTETLDDLSSVDIVFTDDITLWTKVVVAEMGSDPFITEGKAAKNAIRRHASWNTDGTYAQSSVTSLAEGSRYYVSGTSASSITYTTTDGEENLPANNFFQATDLNGGAFTANNGAQVFAASDIGYSYFPGYAINIETGERLNMIFSENSFYGSDNGKDMIWNPTSTIVTPTFQTRVGGEHYMYVMNSKYDSGNRYHDLLIDYEINNDIADKRAVWDEGMWTALTFLSPGFEFKSLEDGLIPTRVDIKVRVRKPYEQSAANNPKLKYEFDFSDYAATAGDQEVAEDALDLVQVVPNPYYAFSEYETSQLDNRVRITNLPDKTKVSIFMLDGGLIRSFSIDNSGSSTKTEAGGRVGFESINSIDWDLKNFKGIPIASGMYLIHVEDQVTGAEKTVKWYCISRPVDLDVF